MSNFYNLNDSSEFYNQVMICGKFIKNLTLNLYTVKYEDLVNDFDNSEKK